MPNIRKWVKSLAIDVDKICMDCAQGSDETCPLCPMRKYMDAVPKLRRVNQVLDYVRKGGIAPEDGVQIAICQDVIESIVG